MMMMTTMTTMTTTNTLPLMTKTKIVISMTMAIMMMMMMMMMTKLNYHQDAQNYEDEHDDGDDIKISSLLHATKYAMYVGWKRTCGYHMMI